MVIEKHITLGEKIGDGKAFTIANLTEASVDLRIPVKDLMRVSEGQSVEVTSTDGVVATGTLSLVGPVVDAESRTALGRVTLPNLKGQWKPGIFVTGSIKGESGSSTVVVPSEAVQNIDGKDIVFVPYGDGFMPVAVSPEGP